MRCCQCVILQFTMPPLRDTMSKVRIHWVTGMCTTTGVPGPRATLPPHSDPHTLTRPPSLTPSPSHLGLVKRIVELGEQIRHSPQSLHDMKFRPNAKSETAVARYASERAETGSRRRGLQRSIGRSERGPDGSNPGRPAGESNPIAWPKPEARHRSRASWKMHARIDSRQQ